MSNAERSRTPRPVSRKLQIYAFDPGLDLDLKTAHVNRSTIHVAWEDVAYGPVGDYIEVVDIDPASASAYAPVNLDDPYLLAQDGLAPSEGNPQFHQQMVYAVAMKTIANFEGALGRKVHWSPKRRDDQGNWLGAKDSYVRRLRIYPHALREANAYYSPDKKALLFGYFNAANEDPMDGLPGGMIFSCLSHDIISHEMTHAILDGIHRRLLEPSNPDVLAFHEAFADVVAIFQHFTLPGVLEHQIEQTRGDLSTENLLSQLAMQFGHATNRGSSLRDALGTTDPTTGVWKRRKADPSVLREVFEPHARGATLVAALFEAFLAMYESHTEDLLRIASGAGGVQAEGRLHPDLVKRLADEARTVSHRLLRICIRALDYLPPVDVTFGDFLRALITIDSDLVPDDTRHYRTALICAFRDRGIYPRDLRTLSVESLRWSEPTDTEQQLFSKLLPPSNVLRTIAYANDFADIDGDSTKRSADDDSTGLMIETGTTNERLVERYQELGSDRSYARDRSFAKDESKPRDEREHEYLNERQFARYLHNYLYTTAREYSREAESAADFEKKRETILDLLGIDLLDDSLRFEVHAVRPTVRVHPDGRTKNELLILITQRQKRSIGMASMAAADASEATSELWYRFRGGCTLLVDPLTGEVTYCIVKRISGERRRDRQEAFLQMRLSEEGLDARARYHVWTATDGKSERYVRQEPFRLLHSGSTQGSWL